MKKLLIICFGLFLLVGCSDTTNTPSKKVEDFLGKYQKLDNDVLTQLDITLDSDTEMNSEQKKDYKALMEKQYQNLSYKITNENIDGETATVDTEIEVYDYVTNINKSKQYYSEHKDEFVTDNDQTGVKKYLDYKIKELKDVTDKTTYTMTFYLTKEDDNWKLEDISDTDIQKLHGLY